MDEGWLYGEWETGPWWAFHTKEKAVGSYGWLGLGTGMRGPQLTWRHTCVVADFIEGHTKLFENGEKYFDKTGIKDMQETYKKNKKTIDMVAVGCVHKTGATPMMSAHGRVTDFQMWDHVLPDEQLLKVT